MNKEAEVNVQKHYEKAETKLQEAVNTAVEYIQQEVEGVLQSNLVKTFVACLDRSQNISAQNVDSGLDEERIKGQVNMLKSIGDTAGVSLTKLATRGVVKTASGQGFLRSLDVAGSGMHQGVVAVGKFVGFKFKPWQAVNIAKNIGNAAKFLGPALAIVSVGVDVHASLQERRREKEMADIRQEITSQFQTIAKDLENQVQIQLWEFERQVYGEIEKKIAEARHQEESAIATSNTWVKQLAEIRKDFELILRYITKSAETPIA